MSITETNIVQKAQQTFSAHLHRFYKKVPRSANELMLLAVKEIAELERAFGGCDLCYGKGYSTQMMGETLQVNLCVCGRGKQLDDVLLAVQRRRAVVKI